MWFRRRDKYEIVESHELDRPVCFFVRYLPAGGSRWEFIEEQFPRHLPVTYPTYDEALATIAPHKERIAEVRADYERRSKAAKSIRYTVR